MLIEHFIGLLFLLFVVISGTIGILGWYNESIKNDKLRAEKEKLIEEIKSNQSEIFRLKSWISIQKAVDEGVNFDDVER